MSEDLNDGEKNGRHALYQQKYRSRRVSKIIQMVAASHQQLTSAETAEQAIK
ncbi:hypothetical protein PAHAL_5G490700 [Panicum hallii]|jgi:hypothetical protein|uniref:Uncharacterized protein n=1 Tax=Panicum hallii TaxID=206008 RepID=A0A2T8INZ0_9POAL|nr:hypothetical protein PAHAL_5G490700 [Panicum hallii]